jgi:hypothetical protein
MMRFTNTIRWSVVILSSALFLSVNTATVLHAKSLDIPIKGYGLSFGNSKRFNGVRFNFRDSQVEEINGINFTLWRAKENKQAIVRGMSLGLLPEAGDLLGLQMGLGIAAERELKGVSLGLLGAGAGNNTLGITIGGLGAGSGGDMTGIAIGGLGAGAGRDMKGITITLLGAGAGRDATGVTIGGLGAGAGRNMTGISVGGVGAGCGNELKGITVGGIGAGAPKIQGFAIGGFAAGGQHIKGATLALGWAKVEGSLLGFTASAFNQIKGKQTGVSLGIVNYAYELRGIQIGLINYVRESPRYLRVLPLINVRL